MKRDASQADRRFHSDQLKIALSFSLLSIVALVTFANNNLLSASEESSLSRDEGAPAPRGARGIASVNPQADVVDQYANENPQIARELSHRDLSPGGQVGHQPSALEKLAFGYLEGKYTVHLQNGKIASIELSDAGLDEAKRVENPTHFLESQRDLLPEFDRAVVADKAAAAVEAKADGEKVEVYDLLPATDHLDTSPVAKVLFHLDESGHLISLQVSPLRIASK